MYEVLAGAFVALAFTCLHLLSENKKRKQETNILKDVVNDLTEVLNDLKSVTSVNTGVLNVVCKIANVRKIKTQKEGNEKSLEVVVGSTVYVVDLKTGVRIP